ncbi:MAG TPA: hypothetical protein VN042_14075 [Asticcacaulis sp.]|nr:hypothetical protein [Asticcacaulis sp.]
MTDTPFYFVTPPAMLPDDVKKASERMVNLWMGAMSPLWAPFWAASSFGVGMWALARNVKPAESLMDDMKSDAWLGLFKSWGLEAGELHEKAVEAVEQASHEAPVAPDAAEAVTATQETVSESMAEAADVAAAAAQSLSEAAPEIAESASVVTEDAPTPVEALTKAVSEPVVKSAPSAQPKPIARAVSAQRKPKTKA